MRIFGRTAECKIEIYIMCIDKKKGYNKIPNMQNTSKYQSQTCIVFHVKQQHQRTSLNPALPLESPVPSRFD